MRLQLSRPLVFFDLETTGVNISTDRIVEISLIKHRPDGCVETKTWRVNPGIPIPAEATAVHHITDEDVAACPQFRDLAPEVLAFIADADLAGYNSNHFDVPMLQEELLRAGFDTDLRKDHHFVDAFVIFQKHTPRTLTAAYMHYCGKTLDDAHSANADTEATRQVLLRQVEVHPDVPCTVEELEEYTNVQHFADMAGRLAYDNEGRIIFNFGKHKGRTVREVFSTESGYYNWMMDGEFPLYTKHIITEIMQEIRAEKRAVKARPAAPKNAQSTPPAPATADDLRALADRFRKPRTDGQQSLFD